MSMNLDRPNQNKYNVRFAAFIVRLMGVKTKREMATRYIRSKITDRSLRQQTAPFSTLAGSFYVLASESINLGQETAGTFE